jgi:hypothetical protein
MPVRLGKLTNLTTFCYNMHMGKLPLGKPRADPVSLASGKPCLVRLSLFGSGLFELGVAILVQAIMSRLENQYCFAMDNTGMSLRIHQSQENS